AGVPDRRRHRSRTGAGPRLPDREGRRRQLHDGLFDRLARCRLPVFDADRRHLRLPARAQRGTTRPRGGVGPRMNTLPFPPARLAVGCAAALLVAACSVTPYRTPGVSVPETYGDKAGNGVQIASSFDYAASDVAADPWWLAFG